MERVFVAQGLATTSSPRLARTVVARSERAVGFKQLRANFYTPNFMHGPHDPAPRTDGRLASVEGEIRQWLAPLQKVFKSPFGTPQNPAPKRAIGCRFTMTSLANLAIKGRIISRVLWKICGLTKPASWLTTESMTAKPPTGRLYL